MKLSGWRRGTGTADLSATLAASLKVTRRPPSPPRGLRTPTAARRRSAPWRHPRRHLPTAGQTCSFPNQKSICNVSHSFPHRGDGAELASSCRVSLAQQELSTKLAHARLKPGADWLTADWLADSGEGEHGTGVSYVSSAVLQAHDVGVLAQLCHSIQRQLQARVSRHAVQNHRHRAAVRHLRVRHGRVRQVQPHPSLTLVANGS